MGRTVLHCGILYDCRVFKRLELKKKYGVVTKRRTRHQTEAFEFVGRLFLVEGGLANIKGICAANGNGDRALLLNFLIRGYNNEIIFKKVVLTRLYSE